MPLRGSLFRKLKKLRKQREKSEARKFKRESKKEAKQLKKLRGTRIKTEGRALLRRQIAMEKKRIKIAKKPTRIGRFEGFLAKKAKKGAKAGLKQVKKRRPRIKIKLN